MKSFSLAIAFVSTLLLTTSSHALDEAPRQLFKVTFGPLGSEVVVSDLQVKPSELTLMRESHAGVPTNDVVPCLTDNGWATSKYVRVNDVAEISIATEEIKSFYKGYGAIRSYPLKVMPKAGGGFLAASSEAGSPAQPWAVCKATGDLKWHAFGFENLTMRVVNSSAVLNVKTLEVMTLKSLSQKEQDELKYTESLDFQKANETATLDAISQFVVRYAFSDIANLVPMAEQQLQQISNAINAPILAKQAKEEQERSRLAWESMNNFRNLLAVGTESNCGPVIEMKGDLVKVYHPVANFGNEHWIRRDALYPAGSNCLFQNGTYRGK